VKLTVGDEIKSEGYSLTRNEGGVVDAT